MISITCPQCEGRGEVGLSEHLAVTLALVKSGTTADEIHGKLGLDITVNAISNRLLDLFLLGLVTREKQGKCWHYTRTKKGR